MASNVNSLMRDGRKPMSEDKTRVAVGSTLLLVMALVSSGLVTLLA